MTYLFYVLLNFILFFLLFIFVARLYGNTGYIYTQLLNFYSFFTVFISLVVLEYGFYITESLNYSYLNGSTVFFIVFLFAFFFVLRLFIGFIDRYKPSVVVKSKISSFNRRLIALLVLIGSAIFLFSLILNLALSPVPIISESVNRLNYWDHARFPFLKNILGERSLPLAITLGIVFNYFRKNKMSYSKWSSLILFFVYIIYILLIGHKFSPLMLAIFFFLLPFLINKKPSFIFLFKYAFLFFLIMIVYVFYSYSKIDSGIVSLYGGPIGGVLYRIFILQGHVFWNMVNNIDVLSMSSWEDLLWFIKSKFDGLVLTMKIVSPSLVDAYLSSGVRFTAGFPGFLLALPLIFSIIFIFLAVLFYAFVVARVVQLAQTESILRLIIYMMFLYFFHFGFTMGDFRFLFSAKFLLFLSLLIFIELILLSATRNKSNYTKITSVVSKYKIQNTGDL